MILKGASAPGLRSPRSAVARIADRGLLYAREVRENLARAGMIIYDSVEMPDVEPPQYKNELNELNNVNDDYPADEEDAENE